MTAQAAAGHQEAGFPAGIVRFVLEYPTAPDLGTARTEIARLIGADVPDLSPIDPALPQFLVLQFPGVARRLSPETLFHCAAYLGEALGLISATPDIAARFIAVPPEQDRLEGVIGDRLRATCSAPPEPDIDGLWAVRALRADRAWQKTDGAGAVIVQADTGIAGHDEIADVVDMDRGRNTLEGTDDATDPLEEDERFAGHGTATASIIGSRPDGRAHGMAPGATIVPVRCVTSVVLGFDPTPLAKAILYAAEIRADVISMSIGGPFHSQVVSAALAVAAAAGVIPVAAAGNCVQPVVVFPARDPNTLAMAGMNRQDQPWRGTSRGAAIDLASPAENLFVARRRPGDQRRDFCDQSQGTSYAAASAAGVAALWVSHFGRDAIQLEAARRGVTVLALFRNAARATARVPDDWDADKFGAGIMDAAALLDLPLDAIPESAPAEAVSDAVAGDLDTQDTPGDFYADTRHSLEIAAGSGAWHRHGAEAVYLAQDDWARANNSIAPLESARRPEPSPALAALLPGAEAPMRAETRAQAPAQARAQFRAQAAPLQPLDQALPYARMLAAGSPSGHESSAALSESDARARLMGDQGARIRQETEAVMSALGQNTRGSIDEADQGGDAARRAMIAEIDTVIDKVAHDAVADLNLSQRVTLEALVRIKDRPAFRTTDANIDFNDPLRGEWGGFLSFLVDVPSFARSVGRIDVNGRHMGTGFVIGPNLVMTNRHVLESIADEIAGPNGQFWAFTRGAATIDFSDLADGSARFAIDRVVMAGPNPIRGVEDFDNLDMAIVHVTGDTPPPLAFARSPQPATEVMVIGYPARPGTSAMIDPATGDFNTEIADRLRLIFGTKFGCRYVSPGRIITPLGQVAGDAREWIFAHDCTTMGGNSGSCIIQLSSTDGVMAVSGLHYSGQPLTANRGHGLAAVDTQIGGISDAITWVTGS